jgi:hypothetical protein
MVGVGQRREEPSDEEAAPTAALWEPSLVHPTVSTYRKMADQIEKDLANMEARYTNPARKMGEQSTLGLTLAWIERSGSAAARQPRPNMISTPPPPLQYKGGAVPGGAAQSDSGEPTTEARQAADTAEALFTVDTVPDEGDGSC